MLSEEFKGYGLKIGRDTDFYRTPILVDAETGKRARFMSKLTNKGWTVVLAIGSKRTGRTERNIECGNTYTMHQSQVVAEVQERDEFGRLFEVDI